MNETTNTIADVPELAADFLQLTIENTLAGLIDAEAAQEALIGIDEFAQATGKFALGYHRGKNGFYVPIEPALTRFEFNSRPEPNIIIALAQSAGVVRIGPLLDIRSPRVEYEKPIVT